MNSLVASQSGGRISSLVTPEDKLAMTVEDPLAVVAGNHFEGKFTDEPSETSLNYINLPRGRRIVPVDALGWVAAFNAGYEPLLDCTAVRAKRDCFLWRSFWQMGIVLTRGLVCPLTCSLFPHSKNVVPDIQDN